MVSDDEEDEDEDKGEDEYEKNMSEQYCFSEERGKYSIMFWRITIT